MKGASRFSAALLLALTIGAGLGTPWGVAAAQGLSAGNQAPLTASADVPDLVHARTAKTAALADVAVAKAMRSREVMRSRPVDIDLSVLNRMRAGSAANPRPTMRIAFFDDAAIAVQITRAESFGGAGTAYIGIVPGVELGSAVIVEEDGVVSGNVDLPGRKYQIRNFGATGHVALQIDERGFPPEHASPPIEIDAPPLSAAHAQDRSIAKDFPTAADDGSLIDVMVVYTPPTPAATSFSACASSTWAK
jgi:hypothetical protein